MHAMAGWQDNCGSLDNAFDGIYLKRIVIITPVMFSKPVTRVRAWRPGFDPRVQTGSEAHPASYTTDTAVSFPGGKAVGE